MAVRSSLLPDAAPLLVGGGGAARGAGARPPSPVLPPPAPWASPVPPSLDPQAAPGAVVPNSTATTGAPGGGGWGGCPAVRVFLGLCWGGPISPHPSTALRVSPWCHPPPPRWLSASWSHTCIPQSLWGVVWVMGTGTQICPQTEGVAEPSCKGTLWSLLPGDTAEQPLAQSGGVTPEHFGVAAPGSAPWCEGGGCPPHPCPQMLPSPSRSSKSGHAAVTDFLGKVPAGAQRGRCCSLAGPACLVLHGTTGNPRVLLRVLLWMGASPCLWVVGFTSLRLG